MPDSPIALSQDMILDKLKNVIDPELFVNSVDLGLVYEVEVDADNPTTEDQADPQTEELAGEDETPVEGSCVKIDMTMTSPACPAGPQLIAGAKKEVGSLEGVGAVEVKIVLDPPWTPDRMTEDAKDQLGIF